MQEAEMDHLDRLESESVYIIREAYKKYQKPAMLWSAGKDSTTLSHLARKAFLGKVPIPAIYIDSVPSDSPIILRRKNGVDITSIEDLWTSTNSPTKTTGKGEGIKKVENVETFNGKSSWTPIKYIIRHPYSGKILRLNTLTSAVDVSPNHSVMTPKKNGWKARDASEIKVGDRIATSEIVPRPNIGQGRKGGFFVGTEDLAWLYGLFVAEGSAYKTTRSDNKKYSRHFVSISNKDEELLEKTKSIISDNFHVKSSINEDSGCKKLASSNKSMYEFFKSNFYTRNGSKKIPKSVLIAPKEVKKSFIKGYDEGDGSHSRDMGKSLDSFTSKSQPLMAGLLWLATEVGNQDYSVHIREDKPNISQIMFNKPESKRRKSTKKVKKIIEYDYEGYLYDLETEDHAFYSGVGLPVRLHNTGYHFDEMYEFRDKLAEDWGLNLVIAKNEEAEEKGITPDDKIECCKMRKTRALKDTMAENGFDALLVGIRRDEHGIRAKERTFSPRDQDFQWDYKDQPPELWDQYKSEKEAGQHLRVHPLLSWTELDVWKYIKRENLPVNPLYFAEDGERFRSLGCKPCTDPVESNVKNIDDMIKEVKESKIGERSGRAQDKESAHAMQRLRALGYMIVL